MDTQIIAVVAAAAATVLTVVTTLGLALLSGFRRLYNTIHQITGELRGEIAAQTGELRGEIAAQTGELRSEITKNAESILGIREAVAGIEGRLAATESVLKAILRAVLPSSSPTVENPTEDTPASQTPPEQNQRVATAAATYAPGR